MIRGLNTMGLDEDLVVKLAMEEIGGKQFTKPQKKIGYGYQGVDITQEGLQSDLDALDNKIFKKSIS